MLVVVDSIHCYDTHGIALSRTEVGSQQLVLAA